MNERKCIYVHLQCILLIINEEFICSFFKKLCLIEWCAPFMELIIIMKQINDFSFFCKMIKILNTEIFNM